MFPENKMIKNSEQRCRDNGVAQREAEAEPTI